jgi:hypothetical protein
MSPHQTPATTTPVAILACSTNSVLPIDPIALFAPTLSAWCTAIDAGRLTAFPDLTSDQGQRHPPPFSGLVKGHLDQQTSVPQIPSTNNERTSDPLNRRCLYQQRPRLDRQRKSYRRLSFADRTAIPKHLPRVRRLPTSQWSSQKSLHHPFPNAIGFRKYRHGSHLRLRQQYNPRRPDEDLIRP